MGESEPFDALSVRAHDRGVSAELGLREDNSNAHSRCNRTAAGLLPACDGKVWDGAVFTPLGKWSLEATILKWYPGECPTPSRSTTTPGAGIFPPPR
ncbi:hypothetical protein MSEO_39280 [Mycobacterium seoulense]|uniref:Uncharacterized protein n=1 Tax=Mycobacterium seoulense TaxID=386911 RepID=A0A7I7P402_9MYCO|nr:hypothetical protein MSEO_39280 [Mycobacterium seoulense]